VAFYAPERIKMTKRDNSSTKAFDSASEVVIGNKVYLVERHFTGKRDFQQAVFSAVENEVKRERKTKESA